MWTWRSFIWGAFTAFGLFFSEECGFDKVCTQVALGGSEVIGNGNGNGGWDGGGGWTPGMHTIT